MDRILKTNLLLMNRILEHCLLKKGLILRAGLVKDGRVLTLFGLLLSSPKVNLSLLLKLKLVSTDYHNRRRWLFLSHLEIKILKWLINWSTKKVIL